MVVQLVNYNYTNTNLGNGYLDSVQGLFPTASSSADVFVATLRDKEIGKDKVVMFEPISYVGGGTQQTLIFNTTGTGVFNDAIVGNDGYLYIATETGIIRKSARGDFATTACTPTTLGDGDNCARIITAEVAIQLRKYQNYIYFMVRNADGNQIRRFSTSGVDAFSTSVVVSPACLDECVGFDIDASGSIWHAEFDYTSFASDIFRLYKDNVQQGSNLAAGAPPISTPTAWSGQFLKVGNEYFMGWGNFQAPSTFLYKGIKANSTFQVEGGYPFCKNYNLQNFVTGDEDSRGKLANGEKSTIAMAVCGSGTKAFREDTPSGTDYIQSYSTNATTDYGAGLIAQLTYKNSIIVSLYDNYYQNQKVSLQETIRISDDEFSPVQDNYLYRVEIIDQNNTFVSDAGYFSLVYNPDNEILCVITSSCDWGSSAQAVFSPNPLWVYGNYTARLVEYNTTSGNTGILDTDTFAIFLGNATSITPGTTPTIPSTATTNKFDAWVQLMGLGLTPASKFLFAALFIIITIFAGMLMSGGNANAALVAGFLPFGFFIFIEYLPYWFAILAIITIALKTGWFR